MLSSAPPAGESSMSVRASLSIIVAALTLTGCVVAPPPQQTWGPPPGAVFAPAPAYGAPGEYIPPPEYVVDGPLYYDAWPGIPWYPLFIDTPGSCHCVMPMRFHDGVWWSLEGVVVFRGFFPYRRPEFHHIETWRSRPWVVQGRPPVRGEFEWRGGRSVPLPPPGGVHGLPPAPGVRPMPLPAPAPRPQVMPAPSREPVRPAPLMSVPSGPMGGAPGPAPQFRPESMPHVTPPIPGQAPAPGFGSPPAAGMPRAPAPMSAPPLAPPPTVTPPRMPVPGPAPAPQRGPEAPRQAHCHPDGRC
jgi:hypothetical protein